MRDSQAIKLEAAEKMFSLARDLDFEASLWTLWDNEGFTEEDWLKWQGLHRAITECRDTLTALLNGEKTG